MKLLLILALAITASAQVDPKQGERLTQWEPLIQTQVEGVDVRATYAPESIRRGEGYTKLWIRLEFPNGGSVIFPSWHGADVGEFRGFVVMRCAAKSLEGGSIILYDMQGNVMFEKRLKESVMEANGSVGQLLLNGFCEREPTILKTAPKLRPVSSSPGDSDRQSGAESRAKKRTAHPAREP